GEAEGRRGAGRAALHAAALRSGLRDGRDAGRSRARRWRHVRFRLGQTLPPTLREVLRARRRLLLGLSRSLMLEVLRQLQALRLVMRADAAAIDRVGDIGELVVDQPADDLPVL